METIFIIIYLLKKNCSENNLSKKVHNFFLFPIVKTVWPLEVLRNSALLNMLAIEIHLILVVCFANYFFFLTILKLKQFEHGITNDTVLSGLLQILPCRLTMA